jgi:EAL domain-containing protein (putative c-di-GMP-specific phosphodiesterase class I)
VPPDEFIALSEDTGLIVPMTVKLLKQACRTLAEWQKGPSPHERLTMSVNISGKHFSEGDLVAQIKAVLAETAIDPVDLKLEVTESAVMENAEQAILTLKQIRETGVRISIDDFGTGYSSLSYLHRFPIDVLKIDRSFVSTMEDGSENGEIVRTVIALAKTLNLNVVAEGIESIHQLHQLRILGCEFGQGYLFSRPLPAQEIRRLLDDNNRWQGIAPQAALPVFPRDGDYTHLPFAQ